MLTGYLRVRGEVQVLGLISVCIRSTLYLTYYSESGKLEVQWVLRVKVLFLRKTVRVRFEKRFAGQRRPHLRRIDGPGGRHRRAPLGPNTAAPSRRPEGPTRIGRTRP